MELLPRLYQGAGAGYTAEHADRRTSNTSDPQEREVNPLLSKVPTRGCLWWGMSDKEYCLKPCCSWAGSHSEQYTVQGSDWKSASMQITSSSQWTSQGTHAEIHPTWLQNLVFHLTKDEMSNSKHKDEQTFQELWRAALSNQQQHSLSYSHLKWELSVSLATLQAKSVHWSVEAFGPLVSGAIWVGELVIWDYSVLNHSQLMCCGRSHALCKISLSPSSSFPFILQTIKTV